jgi:hypothetical protein
MLAMIEVGFGDGVDQGKPHSAELGSSFGFCRNSIVKGGEDFGVGGRRRYEFVNPANQLLRKSMGFSWLDRSPI